MSTTTTDCLASLIDRHDAPGDHLWTIGDLSRECGVTLRALRFYEGKGLLRPARSGTARLYDAEDRRRVAIIVRAKRLGLSLIEIRDLLELIFSPAPTGRRLEGSLERLRRQVEQLEAQRHEVEQSLVFIAEEISALETRLRA